MLASQNTFRFTKIKMDKFTTYPELNISQGAAECGNSYGIHSRCEHMWKLSPCLEGDIKGQHVNEEEDKDGEGMHQNIERGRETIDALPP